MIPSNLVPIKRVAQTLAIGMLLATVIPGARAQEKDPKADRIEAEITLVRVNITTETRGEGETVVINDRRIPNYHPKIIEIFPSTGLVIDDKGHVLTFLGYRWVDIQARDRRIEIQTNVGRKLPGKMVGIDQSNGVAVIKAQEDGLAKTPLCLRCEIRDGDTVVIPILENQGPSQFTSAKIISVGTLNESPDGGWEVTVNRRLPGIGEPLLDAEHRALGFVTSQDPSPQDPMGMQTVLFPMTQLLTSAEKIIRTGGDIRTGWLGVYLDYSPQKPSSGVRINSVLENSPAQKAGLAAEDILVKWNGTVIRDAMQFIRLVQDTQAGTKVDLEVMRRGKPANLTAMIENRKPEESQGTIIFKFPEEISLPSSRVEGEITYRKLPGPQTRGDRPRIGIDIVALTPQLAGYLQMPGQLGLLVSAVEAKMPAALAGVQVGDVILSVDGQRVLDPRAFSSYIQSRYWGNTISLKLLRKGTERSAAILLKQPAEQSSPQARKP